MPQRYARLPGRAGDGIKIESPDKTGYFARYCSNGSAQVELQSPLVAPTGNSVSEAFNADGSHAGWQAVGGVSDHGGLTGLTDDDHSQYGLLLGRSGGQALIGGTASGNNLTLQSTSHGTKGKILLSTSSAYDEVNHRLGLRTTSPTEELEISTAVADSFTNSANIRCSYSADQANYANGIYNLFSGTNTLHRMEFRIKCAGVEITPLTFTASGRTTFAGNIGINTGSAIPAGTIELANSTTTDAVFVVMSNSASLGFSHQIKGSFDGSTDALNKMKLFVTKADGATDVNVLTLLGDGNAEFIGKVTSKGSYQPWNDATDGATVTFNLALSNLHRVTLEGNRTLALSNVSIGQPFHVRILQDGTGSRTVTWWSGIKWAGGGTPPTLTTTANKADVFMFMCTSSGNYDGFVAGQNI